MRDADQLGIGEFHAGSGVAIVEQHLDAILEQRAVEVLGGLRDPRRLACVEGDHHDAERCEGLRPDDSRRVVVLLDRRGDDALDGTNGHWGSVVG